MLERVERRSTKIIHKLRDVSCEMRLRECGLTTLETRRSRGHKIKVLKIVYGYDYTDRSTCSRLRKIEGLEDMK